MNPKQQTQNTRNLLSRTKPLAWTTMAAAIVACPSVAGAQTSATTPPTAPKAPAQSAGVLNDWLRSQSSQWQPWDIGGQVRGRYECFDGGSPAAPNADFQATGVDNDTWTFLSREKFHLGYTAKWFNIYAEMRNSDANGDDTPLYPGGNDSIDLQQAYIALGDPKSFPISAKVGRQELVYGDERLVGASDWSNTGRVFDAAKLRYEDKNFWVDVFGGRVVLTPDNGFNNVDWDDWFSGVYASSKTLIPIQESQLYFLSRNVGEGSTAGVSPRDIYSLGFRVKSLPGKLKGWDYSAELVKQFGNIVQSGVKRDQDAWATSVGGGYTWTQAFGSPRLGLEYSYSSGDQDPTDGKSQTLDNLFPTNHKHYGTMDFFSWRNLHDPRISLSLKPVKKLTCSVDYHGFWLADTHDYFYPQSGAGRSKLGYGRNAGYNSFVGSEIDVELNYAFANWLGFRGGYGHFFPGSYVESSKQAYGTTSADWFYLQATVSF